MATSIQVVIDCADPAALSRFWAETLHYKLQDPPTGYASWPDFLRAQGVPESEFNSASAIVDPDGAGPRVFFQRVPDQKSVKNRLHLDLRPQDQAAEVERLIALGATRVDVGQDDDVTWVVLADPEGNEFCIIRALTPEELAE